MANRIALNAYAKPRSSSLALVLPHLALEIRALAAHGARRPAEALAMLEESSMAVTHSSKAGVHLYRRPSSVFLRAKLLQQLDRGEEALAWYSSFFDFPGYVFLSPTCMRMAEIPSLINCARKPVRLSRTLKHLPSVWMRRAVST